MYEQILLDETAFTGITYAFFGNVPKKWVLNNVKVEDISKCVFRSSFYI